MTLKDDWETGDVFTAADANDVADAINSLTVPFSIDGGSPESTDDIVADGGTP